MHAHNTRTLTVKYGLEMQQVSPPSPPSVNSNRVRDQNRYNTQICFINSEMIYYLLGLSELMLIKLK